MKKFIKTIVSLTAASAMLLSTTAFAAVTTQTVTKYSAGSTKVTSTVSGDELAQGTMVTYLAHTEGAVKDDGSNIVYIGQETVDSSKSATFEYTITDEIPVGSTYATVKFGSNGVPITDTNTVEVGQATVTWDEKGVVGEVVTKLVGKGQEVDLILKPADGSEIVKIVKNNKEELDPLNRTVKATAGDNFVVTAIPTTGDTAAVYQLVGAKVDLQEGYVYKNDNGEVYTNSGIVRVIGSVAKVYFVFKDDDTTYTMDGEVEDGHFIVDGVIGNGYYGVEIEDKVDVSNYSVEAHAVVVNPEGAEEEIGVTKIQ